MWLTALQASQRIGRKSARTVLRRPIPKFREGGAWRLREADVEAYIERRTVRPQSAGLREPVREWESFADIGA